MKALICTLIIALLHFIQSSPAGGRLFTGGVEAPFSLPLQVSCSATGLKASSIRETKVTFSYSVKGSQVTGFGVCYGKTEAPSLRNSAIIKSYVGDARDIPMGVSFKESVTDLDTATTYFARAYIVDSGGKVYYSEEISFTTEKKEDFSSILNGPKVDYHPNGQVARRYTVKDGVPQGSYRSYSDSGKIVSDQYLVDGVPNGMTKTFYSNGNIRSEVQYVDGLPQGESKEFYPNGNLKSESMISGEMDRLSIQSKQYYEEGGLKSETITSMGDFVYSITYDEEGRVTSEQKPGTIISYWYDRDGAKHSSINGEKCQCAKCNN
ncbi:toxin-antitoxin system YwqK family antitoxin [bacterium]|nr:toxin-antitoxin system YwqK family antitoxin [bacterium]